MIEYEIDYLSLHKKLIDTLLNRVLGKYMSRYIKSGQYYPVVVGGQNVLRCASLTDKSNKLIEGVFSTDIDLEFVIMKPIGSLDDRMIQTVNDVRLKLLTDVLNDEELVNTLHSIETDNYSIGLFVNLRLDNDMMNLPEDHEAAPARVIRIRAEYFIGYEMQHSIVLMDTSLYSTLSRRKAFNSYQRFFKDKLNKPVPTVKAHGVLYGTCGHAFYDTVRMLDFYARELDGANNSKRLRMIFVKYANLIAKFVALYSLLNNIKNDQHYNEIQKLYMSVREILIDVDAQNIYAGEISDRHRQMLDRVISVLKGKTNITSLLDVLSGSKQYSMKRTNNKLFTTSGGSSDTIKYLHTRLHNLLLI